MANINLIPQLASCPTGVLTASGLAAMWPGQTVVFPGAQWSLVPVISIQDGIGKSGGRALQFDYPVGTYAHADQFPELHITPCQPLHMQYDVKFGPGFDFGSFTSRTGGKGPMALFWGPEFGVNGGVYNIATWGSHPSSPTGWSPYCQNQRSGTGLPIEFITTTGSQGQTPPPPITWPVPVAGRWYNVEVEIFGGPTGYVKWKLDGVPWVSLDSTSPAWSLTNANDMVALAMYTCFGGTITSACTVASVAYVDNLHVWTSFPDAASHTATFTKGN